MIFSLKLPLNSSETWLESMKPDFLRVCRHVYGRLTRELSPQLTYHSLSHTWRDVLPAASRLARAMRLGDEDCLVVLTAALFHDTGFLLSYENHEHYSIRIARETLPEFGYAAGQIDAIAEVIAATKMPQRPKGLLQQIICDADLDLLGREDFLPLNRKLLGEVLHFSPNRASYKDWLRNQMRFLEDHRFFTPVAEEMRGPGKARNMALIRAELASGNGSTPDHFLRGASC